METKLQQALNSLKQLLLWSDRLGSDEIHEIKRIISILEKED